MKNMLLICEKYAKDHDILFNPVKSNAIIFSKPKALYHKKSDINFEINQNVIPLVSKVLGHVLYENAGGDIDVNYITETFNKSVNMLLADMGHVPSTMLGKLFISYCNSLYGIVLRYLSNKMFDKMSIAWRKAVRKIYRISWRSHNYLLHLIVGCKPVELSLPVIQRMIKFCVNLLNSDNRVIRSLAKRCCHQSFSNMGCNLSYILWKFRDKCVVLSSHSVDYYAELLYKWKVNNRETNCDTNLIANTLLELVETKLKVWSILTKRSAYK